MSLQVSAASSCQMSANDGKNVNSGLTSMLARDEHQPGCHVASVRMDVRLNSLGFKSLANCCGIIKFISLHFVSCLTPVPA